MQLEKRSTLLGIGFIIVLCMFFALMMLRTSSPESTMPTLSSSSSSFSTLSSLTIDGIRCEKTERYEIHRHAHLDIFIDGKAFAVPSDIGYVPDLCLYWLHTHDNDGVIHMESPYNRTFTLGELFHIWGERLSNSQLFDSGPERRVNNNDTDLLSIYVNGKMVDEKLDYRQIPMNAYDQIAIVYGKPPHIIPSSYDFGNNALFD